MAEPTNEKAVDTQPEVHSSAVSDDVTGPIVRPKGWKYKEIKIGPLRLPWYASPPVQLVLVAFVCFMCPGA
jgi:hypothetical protein